MKAVIDVEGKKAIVNTRTDTTILEDGDRAGTDRWHDSTRGTNLMAHVSKNKRTAGREVMSKNSRYHVSSSCTTTAQGEAILRGLRTHSEHGLPYCRAVEDTQPPKLRS